ncbi:MAG: GntR family transcriptional regulator [Clostridiales Family XIII bacterium]|nr:GntR family transcriptional regulator [Clostridiales Family XIII bacterium]
MTISTVSPHDAVEIHQLREGLEGVAARMCAVNHPEDIILQMEQCLDENAEAFLSGQYSKAIGFDNKFHTLLVAGSGNARMIQITEGILHQSGRANFLQATAAARMKRSAVQHRNILRAIKKSDPDLAEKYAREHMRDVQRFILMYQKTHEV